MRYFFIFFITLFVAGNVYAANLRDELYQECMAEKGHSTKTAEETETECYRYGNKTECTTKPKGRGYDPYYARATGECEAQADIHIKKLKTQKATNKSASYVIDAISRAHTVSIGTQVRWGNPTEGIWGTVIPSREGTSSKGKKCREYQVSSFSGDMPQTEYKTACQNGNGNWQILD